MRRIAIMLAIALAASGAQGKAKLVASVKNPGYSGQRLHRVLVIGMSNNPAIRSDFEDAMAAGLTRDGVEAIPGNTILLRPDSANMDMDYLKAQIREHKIEAVLVSRLIKDEKNVTYIPGRDLYRALWVLQLVLRLLPHGLPPGVHPRLSAGPTAPCASRPISTPPSRPRASWCRTGLSDTFNPGKAKKEIDSLVKLVVKEPGEAKYLLKAKPA